MLLCSVVSEVFSIMGYVGVILIPPCWMLLSMSPTSLLNVIINVPYLLVEWVRIGRFSCTTIYVQATVLFNSDLHFYSKWGKTNYFAINDSCFILVISLVHHSFLFHPPPPLMNLSYPSSLISPPHLLL